MRWAYLLVGLLLLSVAFAQVEKSVTVSYGGTRDVSLELNQSAYVSLSVRIEDIPSSVSKMYVTYSSDARDRVFCAPSPKDIDGDYATFTCVVIPGDAFTGSVYFEAYDANGNALDSTVLDLSVMYVEQWYTSKTVARVGADISVGSHDVEVVGASFIYVRLRVDGSPVVAFVNDETELASDLRVVFKGYDPDTGEVFLVFRTRVPVAVSVSSPQYYLAVPRYVYRDGNVVEIPLATSCTSVEYRVKGSDSWERVNAEGGALRLETNADRVYIRCADDRNLVHPVYVRAPEVVEVQPDANEFCPSHGYILPSQCPKTDCGSYCVSHGYVKPPAGMRCEFVPVSGGTDWRTVLAVAVIVLVAVLFYLYRSGKIGLPRKRREMGEVKPIEEAGEVG